MNNRYIIFFILSVVIVFGVITDQLSVHLLIHIFHSLYRMLAGYLLAVILGLSFAILLGSSKYLRYAFKPLLSFFISIPTITWVPFLLMFTGITETTIIITIFLGSFFAIVYNTLDGFDNVDPDLVKVGMMLEYGKLGILYRIFIPASFNNIVVGLKLGIAYSWRALVGAEMLGAAQYGLGYRVFAARMYYDITGLIMALLLIGFIGYLLNRILVIVVEKNTLSKWGIRGH